MSSDTPKRFVGSGDAMTPNRDAYLRAGWEAWEKPTANPLERALDAAVATACNPLLAEVERLREGVANLQKALDVEFEARARLVVRYSQVMEERDGLRSLLREVGAFPTNDLLGRIEDALNVESTNG